MKTQIESTVKIHFHNRWAYPEDKYPFFYISIYTPKRVYRIEEFGKIIEFYIQESKEAISSITDVVSGDRQGIKDMLIYLKREIKSKFNFNLDLDDIHHSFYEMVLKNASASELNYKIMREITIDNSKSGDYNAK